MYVLLLTNIKNMSIWKIIKKKNKKIKYNENQDVIKID